MAKTITGLSPRRELQYQQRVIARIAQALDAAFQREIIRAMQATGKASGNRAATASAGKVHKDKLAVLLARAYRQTFEEFGPRVLVEAPKSHAVIIETKAAEDVFDRASAQWIKKNVARKVTEIGGTTQEQAASIIKAATTEAVTEGLASQAALGELIKTRITEQGGAMSRMRSRVIARTEAHASANAATQEAAKATGLALKKEWISSQGSRTRDDHDDANGQVVAMNETFSIGGEALMFPGDPSGSAANVINCRCAAGYIVSD